MLEVGVGTGISLPQYAPHLRIFGTDISEAMLRKAKRRVADLRLKHVEGLAVMDAEKLEFPDNSFDVVMAQYVVTAVPNPEAALDEFARVLRPGGELIILTRVSADVGMRRFIEQRLQPVVRPARFPDRRIRLVALCAMAGGRAWHGTGRAPSGAAARPFLAGSLPQDRGRRRGLKHYPGRVASSFEARRQARLLKDEVWSLVVRGTAAPCVSNHEAVTSAASLISDVIIMSSHTLHRISVRR